jgi:hypothetical protein
MPLILQQQSDINGPDAPSMLSAESRVCRALEFACLRAATRKLGSGSHVLVDTDSSLCGAVPAEKRADDNDVMHVCITSVGDP